MSYSLQSKALISSATEEWGFKIILLALLHKWGHQGVERWSDRHEAAQLVISAAIHVPACGTEKACGPVNSRWMNQGRNKHVAWDPHPVSVTGNRALAAHVCAVPPLGQQGVPAPCQGQLECSFQISLLCSADVKFMPWNSKKEDNGILFHWLFKICSVPKGWIYKHYWKCGNGCQEFLSSVSAWARVRLLRLQIRGGEILLLDTCWKF